MIDDSSHKFLSSLSLDDYGDCPTRGILFQYFIWNINSLWDSHKSSDQTIELDNVSWCSKFVPFGMFHLGGYHPLPDKCCHSWVELYYYYGYLIGVVFPYPDPYIT